MLHCSADRAGESMNVKCNLIYNAFSVYGNPIHQEILLASGQENVLFIVLGKNNYTAHAYLHIHSLLEKG